MEVIAAVILMLAIIIACVIIYDTNRFVVVETTLESEKIKKEQTFVVLADLHNKSYGKENEKLRLAIDKICPDKILIAGDMLNAKPEADFSKTAAFLKCLADEYPVYYGWGNHEHRLLLYPEVYGTMGEAYKKAVEHKNIYPLVNKKVEFEEEGITLYGSLIEKRFYRRFSVQPMEKGYLEALLGVPEKDKFNLLIAHNPDYFESYAEWGADLVLAGHVHGGIVRLPFLGGVLSPKCRLFPKYDGGKFFVGKSTMILSRGLGVHTIPVRLFNPGELHVVHLVHKNT